MRGWRCVLAGQEGQDCFDFIYDIGIRGIYFLGSWFCQIQTTRLIMFFQPRSKSTPSVGLNLNLLCRSQLYTELRSFYYRLLTDTGCYLAHFSIEGNFCLLGI